MATSIIVRLLPPSPPTHIHSPSFYSYRKQVDNSRKEAQADGITVPTTVDEYCLQHKRQTSSVDMSEDYYDRDDDYYQDYSSSDSEQDVMTSSDDGEEADMVDGDSGTA